MSTSVPVVILVVFLLIFSDHSIFVKSQPQISYYLGNDITITQRFVDGFCIRIDVIAWFHPINIDWVEWKENYFNKNPNYYYQGLVNRIISMFGLTGYSIVGGWVDDNAQRICMHVYFFDSQSKYYDKNLNVLSFTDVFKQQGTGYYDEVNVYSDLQIYDVEPTPTSRTSREIHWINHDYYRAPLWYYIYLSPIMQIEVRVKGLPSYKEVSVLVDGKVMGKVKANTPLTLKLKEGTYTISIDPYEIIVDSKERYVAKSWKQAVTSSGTVVFEYIRMLKVKINTDVSDVRVRFDNSWHQLPYEDWIEVGPHTLFAESSLIIKGGDKERMIHSFSEWSVEGRRYSDNPLTLYVDQPMSIWLFFKSIHEFYVEVISEIGHVSGEGWYKEGSLATIYADHIVYDQSGRKRFVFKGWSGDVSSTTQKLEVIVDSPKRISAQWKTEYYVTVSSLYGNPQGEGWYEEGSIATIKLENTVLEIGGQERFVFAGWKGDVADMSPIVNIKVDSAKNIQAEWIKQYRVQASSEFGKISVEKEWCNEGSIAFIKVSETQHGFLIVDVLSGFEVNGSGIIQNENLERGEVTVKVNGPISVRAVWRKDYTRLLISLIALSIIGIGLAYAYPPSRKKVKNLLNALILRKRETKIIRVERKEETRVIMEEEVPEEQIRKLEEELEKTRGYLSKLEEERARKTISDQAYDSLKREYESKIEWLKSEIERLRKHPQG
ncbi:MAG: hypothetical protein QXS51_03930 [Thermoproteota archaeon]|nr:hypothetical protein [Candidatus Brockarchaeota archaeon]